MIATASGPRLLVAVGLAVVAAQAVGCGGARPAQDAEDPKPEITAVIREYLGDYVEGRGEEACDAYSPAFRADAELRADAQGVEGGCAEGLRTVGPAILENIPAEGREEFRQGLKTAHVSLEFADERALATVRYAFSSRPESKRIELTRVDGRWRISDLAIPAGVPWP